MYFNDNTGKKEVAKKQLLFWSLPEILIITLKRYSNSVNKNQALVHFPLENLDMSPYVVGYDKFSYNYDLMWYMQSQWRCFWWSLYSIC